MNRERELELADRIGSAAAEAEASKSRKEVAKTNHGGRPEPIPADVYTDPDRHARELTAMPRDEWNVPDPADPTRTRVRMSLVVRPEQDDDTDLRERNWERLTQTIPGEDFAVADLA